MVCQSFQYCSCSVVLTLKCVTLISPKTIVCVLSRKGSSSWFVGCIQPHCTPSIANLGFYEGICVSKKPKQTKTQLGLILLFDVYLLKFVRLQIDS